MYRNFQSSQNAVQLSSEFLGHGKRESALEILFEAIRVRRGKSWSSSIEEAMNNFTSLCLNMKNTQAFKDGANQFKLMCQTTNVGSFEAVMRRFFDLCIDEMEKAKDQSREKVLAEDLDNIESPETILLKSISETTRQDRSDRLLLVPILKFTWESFRNVLDTCKNNRNLEKVYAEVCKKAFSFLVHFDRKTEFRKLCEVTRGHLNLIIKYTQNQLSIDLSDSQSMESQLQIRLGQLDAAMALELWAEAFKTMEDIHFLLRMTKKPPHPRILAIFYQKISIVFAKAQVSIFHAIALFKLFILIKDHKKGFKPDELLKVSSKVLTAALSVPLDHEYEDLNAILVPYIETSTPALQLSSILGLSTVPTRKSLIDDLKKSSITQYADPSIVSIFNMFNGPITLRFCHKVSQAISIISENLKEDLSTYLEPIKKIAYFHLLMHLSKIFNCIYVKKLASYSCAYDPNQTLSLCFECRHLGLINFIYDDIEQLFTFTSSSNTLPYGTIKNPNFFCDLVRNVDDMHSLCHTIDEYHVQLIKEFLKDPTAEFTRYKKLHQDIIKYADKRSQETEEINKLQATKLLEEKLKIEQVQAQQLEEDRKKRDERRQKQEIIDKKMRSTFERTSDLSTNDMGKKALKDINAYDKTNGATYSNAQQDLREKEILQHVKKIKKFEKNWETFFFGVKKIEEKAISQYLNNAKGTRVENWKMRENVRLSALRAQNEVQNAIKVRMENASDDIHKFVDESGEKAKELYERSLKEYNDMFEKEREIVSKQKKDEYIKQRKDAYVNKIKERYTRRRDKSSNEKTVSEQPKPPITSTDNPTANETHPKVTKAFSIQSRRTTYFGGEAKSFDAGRNRSKNR